MPGATPGLAIRLRRLTQINVSASLPVMLPGTRQRRLGVSLQGITRMPTRRTLLRLTPGLTALLGTGLAGCVAYPDYYPAPNMVWLPSPGVYVALDYASPLFFYNNAYYYPYGARWYSGSYYHGAWRPIPGPPPPLRGFQPSYWHDYQARAGGYYRGNPGWQHFRPRR